MTRMKSFPTPTPEQPDEACSIDIDGVNYPLDEPVALVLINMQAKCLQLAAERDYYLNQLQTAGLLPEKPPTLQ